MKKYYIVKAKKEDVKNTERVLLNCLVDRFNLCSLIKLIDLADDTSHSYFVIRGEQFSAQRVLSITKKVLLDKGITIKIFYYDTIKSVELDNLIWCVNSNECGKTLKTYDTPLIMNHLKRLTTQFMLKKGLLSNHVFCTECDGFADPVELTSLKGIYRCSFCDAEIVVEGPLLSGKKTVTHLSEQEQLYLIGLPSLTPTNTMISDEIYQGEQISIAWSESVNTEVPTKVRRRRRGMYAILDSSILSRDELEQLSWDIIV